MITRTKIICTLGPATNTPDKILALMHMGMNVARINFSHGTDEEHIQVINLLKEARANLKKPLAIMLDTKGPEIRLGKIHNNELLIKTGSRWLLTRENIIGDENRVSIQPSYVLDRIQKGMRVLFDDGYISSHVVDIIPEGVIVNVDNGGYVKSGKGVNIPNANLGLPPITEKDISDIKLGCQHDIDIIAASFVHSPEQIIMIKRILNEEKKSNILVLAKIENHEGVQNFDSIVQVADGIMIARGDLGVEVPLSHVPRLQKMMIRKSCLAGKPVVTATQMLESMISNPRPTRAEASDVANAIYDSTSAVMLSGETAIGKYPIETVDMMKQIIQDAETDFNYRSFFAQQSGFVYHDVPSSVTLATVKTSYSANAKAIFAFTTSGLTARLLSRLRPGIPIIAMTPSLKSYHQLAFYWGVIPFLCDDSKNMEEAFSKVSAFALENGFVSNGDLVVLTAGSPFGISGTTNMMMVESIGDVLVRAHEGFGQRVYGNVTMVTSLENITEYRLGGQILVISKCDETYHDLLREASGIILQNHVDDQESERYAMEISRNYGIPLLIRADGAFNVLKEGQLVTIDPMKAIVYKGVIL